MAGLAVPDTELAHGPRLPQMRLCPASSHSNLPGPSRPPSRPCTDARYRDEEPFGPVMCSMNTAAFKERCGLCGISRSLRWLQ